MNKYSFHPDKLAFVKEEITLKDRVIVVLKYFLAVIIIGILSYIFFPFLIDTPEVRKLRRENEELVVNFQLLNKRMEQLSAVIADLQSRDDNIYRTIFGAEPIHESIRNAGMGGADRYAKLEKLSNSKIIIETTKKLDILSKKAYIQSRSFDEITVLAKRKRELGRSIPAIMPISNKDLTRVASSFGMRIHPFYKVLKMHTGMDFTAPTGTEVHATGDGRVERIQYAQRGYGYNVIIDHGFGYKTRYAHLSKILVSKGQKVRRGTVVGLVGNTGMSIAPHLHYEVIRNGKPVNPINYYFNDLTPEEYEEVIAISSRMNMSFD